MAKAKGRLMLIKIGDGAGSEAFTTLCALTTKSMEINNANIDVTTPDCTSPGGAMWQELLDGVKSVTVSGEGFSKDETAEMRLNTVAMGVPPTANFQIIVPNFGTYQGAFFVESTGFSGDATGGLTFSLSLSSTGAVTFTAEA